MADHPDTTNRDRLKRRRWADVVVIAAAVYALLAAFWPMEMVSGGGGREVGSQGGLWIAYTAGGVLGLLAVFIAGRAPGLAKALVAAGGVAVLLGFFALTELAPLALVSLGVTGLALLGAAAFVGPMPSPEDEGRPR